MKSQDWQKLKGKSMIHDLMIGNYVKGSDGYVAQVEEIKLNGITTHLGKHLNFNEIEGLQLNDHWLVRFNFHFWAGKSSSTEMTYTKGTFIVHHRVRGWVTKKNDGIIRYVHELQNRFYLARQKHLK